MIDEAEDLEDFDVPLPNMKKETLEKAIKFIEYNIENPLPHIEKPLRSNDIKDYLNEWYSDFIDLDVRGVFIMISAANYLDVRPLLELASAAMAAKMRGKSIEQIREMFDIEYDLTPEDEEQIKIEDSWRNNSK